MTCVADNQIVGWASKGALLAMMLGGCASWRSYPLPLAGPEARQTFEPILVAAAHEGFAAREQPDGVRVELDRATEIRFVLDEETYRMVVEVEPGAVAPEELETRYEEAREAGEDIWQAAMKGLEDEAALPEVDGGQASAAGVSPTGSTHACERLFVCYTRLAEELCSLDDARCQSVFWVQPKGRGGDERSCGEALRAVPTMVRRFQRSESSYSLPGICAAGGPVVSSK